MFSIIIPLYNKALYIEKAIKSITAQTFCEYELIVVDDGSTDNSLVTLKSCDLTGIDLKIICQENKGVSVARNNGVKNAKFNYVAFLDADDWWSPDYLLEQKKLIEEYPEAALYASSYYKVKKGKNIPADIKYYHENGRSLINYFLLYSKSLWMPLWTGSVIIKKHVFVEVNGFNPRLKLGEDFDLWVRIALKYPIAFLKKELAYYNQDVDVTFRAISEKWYKPEEHMLFTDYGELMKNKDFKLLFDNLAVYGLLPYYTNEVNPIEVNALLNNIDWKNQRNRYFIYYKMLPKPLLKSYFKIKSRSIRLIKSILKKV